MRVDFALAKKKRETGRDSPVRRTDNRQTKRGIPSPEHEDQEEETQIPSTEEEGEALPSYRK